MMPIGPLKAATKSADYVDFQALIQSTWIKLHFPKMFSLSSTSTKGFHIAVPQMVNVEVYSTICYQLF